MTDIRNRDLNKDQKAILKHLAENKEANQSELNKVTDRQYSRTLDYLHILRNNYLIHLYKEAPGKGQPAKIWRPTMKGLLISIYENLHLLDKIAESNKHIWIFFKEWHHIKSNKEIREKLEKDMISFIEKEKINKNVPSDILSVHYLPRTLSLYILLKTKLSLYPNNELKYYLQNSVLKEYIKLIMSQTKGDYLRKLVEIQLVENLIEHPTRNNRDLKDLYNDLLKDEVLVDNVTKDIIESLLVGSNSL